LFVLYLRTTAARPTELNARFVHFAPDHSLMREWVLKAGFSEYRTSDLFMPGVDDKFDIQNLSGYEDCSVHAFLCSHVLEHVPDDDLALRELQRVLHPQGWGIILVPILLTLDVTYECRVEASEQERLEQVGQADHVRMYSKDSFMESLSVAGFRTQTIALRDLGLDEANKYGLGPRSTLYVVWKTREGDQ